MRQLILVVLVVASANCGRPRCDVTTCPGCCDPGGVCREVSASTCGASGSVCRACSAGNQCIAGSCAVGSGSGGAAGSTMSGSGGGGGQSSNAGGSTGQGGMLGSGAGGASGDGCSAESKLVYVVDQSNGFWSFDPARFGQANALSRLGTLSCPGAGQPFSMAIDRNAIAWVNYDSSELFRVDIKASLACTATSFRPQQNIGRFGMGFATAGAGSTTDALYIAGQAPSGPFADARFGTLSVPAPHTISVLGNVMASPELSGTGDGHLWGFAPGPSPAIREFDKRNGSVVSGKDFPVPSTAGEPRGWAFAFWGGNFYVFLTKMNEGSATIYRFGPTGQPLGTMPTTSIIVGAGVSTCAPVEIQ